VLALIGLAGLGSLVLLPFRSSEPQGSEFFGRRRASALLAAALGYGVLLDYTIVMVARSLDLAGIIVGILAIAGLAIWGVKLRSWRPFRIDLSWLAFVPLAWFIVVLSLKITTDPIQNWDARSIWFFAAKIIFYNGAFDQSAGIEQGYHADYPKLVATLAAQIAHAVGYWNEYLPKAAFVPLLVSVLLGYLSLLRRPISWVFLVAISFPQMHKHMWNGQMDAYLALYAALATLALGRWLVEARKHDLVLGLVSLGMVVSLKNEGVPLLACIALAFALVAGLRYRWAGASAQPVESAQIAQWKLALWLALFSFAAFFLWEGYKSPWLLETDFELSGGTLATAWGRLQEGEWRRVAKWLFETQGLDMALVPLGLALGVTLAFRTRIPLQFWIPALTLGFYLVGLFIAYLGTPHDLKWHLRTSSHRTVEPLMTLAFAAAFILLEAVERPLRPSNEREHESQLP
jgi:hypothetical protein